jgi:hypothetical protein
MNTKKKISNWRLEIVVKAAQYFNPFQIEEMSQPTKEVIFSSARVNELITLGTAHLSHFPGTNAQRELLLFIALLFLVEL